MDWKGILERCRNIKAKFDRSYKCLNIDRPTKDETTLKHLKILIYCLEDIRVLLNVNYARLTAAHKAAAEAFYQDVRNKLLNITNRKAFNIELPISLHERIEIDKYFSKVESTNMTQTIVEFLNTASKLITDFDGKSENLRSFIDSLTLVDTIKGPHESSAVALIKTKIKGNARNLISNESTIIEIINRLQTTVKGESVEVLTAKILNIKQQTKTANTYCNEIELLTKSLENAYISDGLTSELATKYSTQVAIKALTKNCSIDKVKLIMEAGQFNNMNEAISKFVSSCTEATGQQNAILHYRHRPNPNYFRRTFNRNNNKNNYSRNRNNNTSYNNNRTTNSANNNYNNRNQQRYNNNGRNRNYVRNMTNEERDPENSNLPLRSDQ